MGTTAWGKPSVDPPASEEASGSAEVDSALVAAWPACLHLPLGHTKTVADAGLRREIME
jgi:hypothetical protein